MRDEGSGRYIDNEPPPNSISQAVNAVVANRNLISISVKSAKRNFVRLEFLRTATS